MARRCNPVFFPCSRLVSVVAGGRKNSVGQWRSTNQTCGMSYVTVGVEIEHGRIVAREPEKLPEKASGLLTILPSPGRQAAGPRPVRQRVTPPLIRGDGSRIIAPTPEELDASLRGD